MRDLRSQAGFGMVEVLVTLIILLLGLLGLAGVMVQSQRAEMESYQRVQALILLQGMAGRINVNHQVAACYAYTGVNGTPYLGVGATAVPACAIGTASERARALQDMTDWNGLLNGAAETFGGGSVGAMIGARGCVSYGAGTELLDKNGIAIPGSGIYTIAVAWQGLSKTAVATPNCAQGLYGANDAQRRVVSLTLRVGSLTTL